MVLVFHHFGKDFPKSQKLSPDGFFQMALQLAYYRWAHAQGPGRWAGSPGDSAKCPSCRIYGQACATYESASLRMFHLGRTDTIRSASTDSLAFTKAMDDSSITVRAQVGGDLCWLCPLSVHSSHLPAGSQP